MMYADIFGPYLRKDGRKHIVLKFDDGSRATISWPKWIMERHLGQELEDDETVDHINRDFSDDRIENLRIKERISHAKEDAVRTKLVEIKCAWCGKQALKKPVTLRHNAKNRKAGPFCGKVCAGKYGSAVQNNLIKPLPSQPSVKSEYYKLDKAI